jgi:hypothetical protein
MGIRTGCGDVLQTVERVAQHRPPSDRKSAAVDRHRKSDEGED